MSEDSIKVSKKELVTQLHGNKMKGFLYKDTLNLLEYFNQEDKNNTYYQINKFKFLAIDYIEVPAINSLPRLDGIFGITPY